LPSILKKINFDKVSSKLFNITFTYGRLMIKNIIFILFLYLFQ
jgi:hypothetical protein